MLVPLSLLSTPSVFSRSAMTGVLSSLTVELTAAGLSVADLFDITRNALNAGFMDAGTRDSLLQRVEAEANA